MPDRCIVIGGGFYGSRLALSLRSGGSSVLLLERELVLLGRASLANQARVHNGYHYPRSILTAVRSRLNYAPFREEYREAIDESFEHYYAIPRNHSKTTAAQFLRFCARVGIPAQPARPSVGALFEPARIEAVILVHECAFDAVKLRQRLSGDLAHAGVEVHTGARVTSLKRSSGSIRVTWERQGVEETAGADRVFNCTYSSLNNILHSAGATLIPIKRELTELALVRLPAELAGLGVTVMDGPFFSIMPYPSRPGLSTLSHVRYTPHFSWLDSPSAIPLDGVELLGGFKTRYPHMVRDAARFVPAISSSEYVDSLWEIKALMPRSEQDDSRPILFRESEDFPGLFSVLGAKIDSAYDIEAELDQRFVSA